MRHGCLFAVLVAITCTATPRADAAVTFGSDLSREPLNGYGCWLGATMAQTAFPLRSAAAPVDGVVVRWRLRAGDGPSVPLRIVRQVPDGRFLGVGTSSPGTIDTEGWDWADRTRTYATRLPIRRGDFLGIDLPVGGETVGAFARLSPDLMWQGIPGATLRSWDPPLRDGEARAAGQFVDCFDGADLELLVNADIEADADADGYGDESQDGCPEDAGAHAPPCGPPTAPPGNPPDDSPPAAEAAPAPERAPPRESEGSTGVQEVRPAGERPASQASGFEVSSVRLTARRLVLRGRLRSDCTGPVVVRATLKTRRTNVRRRSSARRSSGRWVATLRGRALRSARVVVRYAGDARCSAATLRLDAKRRR